MNVSILKEIFASMEQGVVFIDDQNRIAYFNQAAEKIQDSSFHEMLGQPILNCHPKKAHTKVMTIIEQLRSGKIKGHQRMNLQLVKGKFYDNTYSAVWGPRESISGRHRRYKRSDR